MAKDTSPPQPSKNILQYFRNTRVLIALVLIIAFLGASIFVVASDVSVHGLTTKVFSASRSCTTPSGSAEKVVTFNIVAGVWSSSSLHTSISNVIFNMSVDGTSVGSYNGAGSSWDPGNSATYKMTFTNVALNPLSLPATSNVVLILTAQVSAGLITSQVTTSDSSLQNFGTTSC